MQVNVLEVGHLTGKPAVTGPGAPVGPGGPWTPGSPCLANDPSGSLVIPGPLPYSDGPHTPHSPWGKHTSKGQKSEQCSERTEK